jgi:hypothetical protein
MSGINPTTAFPYKCDHFYFSYSNNQITLLRTSHDQARLSVNDDKQKKEKQKIGNFRDCKT